MRLLLTAAGGILSRSTAKCLKAANSKLFLLGVDIDPTYLPLSPLSKSYIIPKVSNRYYLNAVNGICRKYKIDIILPQSDVEIKVLGKMRERLAASIWLPKQKVIELSQDKLASQRKMLKNQLPVPETYFVDSLSQVTNLLKKHRTVWLRITVGSGGKGAKLVESVRQAREWLSTFPKSSKFMVAEYLPGRIYAWNSVWKDGKLILCQSIERLRYHQSNAAETSLGIGTSVIRTISNSTVTKIGKQAVIALDSVPDGLFAVDMTENSKGVLCVTEVNAGRFVTTSTMLFEKTKCYLPWYALQLFFGKQIKLKKSINPIKPNLYLVGGRLGEPKLFTSRQIKVPSWKSI